MLFHPKYVELSDCRIAAIHYGFADLGQEVKDAYETHLSAGTLDSATYLLGKRVTNVTIVSESYTAAAVRLTSADISAIAAASYHIEAETSEYPLNELYA